LTASPSGLSSAGSAGDRRPYSDTVDQDTDRDTRRWIALEGAFNFRDLGGYGTVDGGAVRWGSIFRSDALHHLSPEDLELVGALGVDRIIDLRSPDEIEAVGRGRLTDGPIAYLTAPIIPSATGEALAAPPGDDIAERYLWYLDVGRKGFVDAFEVLSRPGGGAVVFHCAAGKDRTGVVAALLLSLLGVTDDDIVADYALTNRALPMILERLAADPVHAESVAQMPASRRTVQPQTMRRFLQMLHDEHGGAQAWLEHAGVSSDSIDHLRSTLRVPLERGMPLVRAKIARPSWAGRCQPSGVVAVYKILLRTVNRPMMASTTITMRMMRPVPTEATTTCKTPLGSFHTPVCGMEPTFYPLQGFRNTPG
jgi:protein-tyrosine phosphatase